MHWSRWKSRDMRSHIEDNIAPYSFSAKQKKSKGTLALQIHTLKMYWQHYMLEFWHIMTGEISYWLERGNTGKRCRLMVRDIEPSPTEFSCSLISLVHFPMSLTFTELTTKCTFQFSSCDFTTRWMPVLSFKGLSFEKKFFWLVAPSWNINNMNGSDGSSQVNGYASSGEEWTVTYYDMIVNDSSMWKQRAKLLVSIMMKPRRHWIIEASHIASRH